MEKDEKKTQPYLILRLSKRCGKVDRLPRSQKTEVTPREHWHCLYEKLISANSINTRQILMGRQFEAEQVANQLAVETKSLRISKPTETFKC